MFINQYFVTLKGQQTERFIKRKTGFISMVKAAEKKAMSDYVTGLLEATQRYDVKESVNSHILIAQKPDLAENPSEIYVKLLAGGVSKDAVKTMLDKNKEDDRYTAFIFYKDDKTFHVRVAGRLKSRKSLSHYTDAERNRMLDLRDLEKLVLGKQGHDNHLIYYQPSTARLDESLRGYEMETVNFKYDYLKEPRNTDGDKEKTEDEIREEERQLALKRRHAKNGPSKTDKIANHRFQIKEVDPTNMFKLLFFRRTGHQYNPMLRVSNI